MTCTCSYNHERLYYRIMDEHTNISDNELLELPLFPLNNIVLFPGMQLPLHIFEERYKTMINHCIEHNTPFGILLIKEGQEVGEPAEPFTIGTSTRITNSQTLQEGRLNISTTGERRFELMRILEKTPYMTGLVRYLDESSDPVPQNIIDSTHQEFRTFLEHQATIAGGWNSNVNLPDDGHELCLRVISAMTVSIELPGELRQKLLETDSYSDRLQKLIPILQRGNEIMSEQSRKSNPFQGHRLN